MARWHGPDKPVGQIDRPISALPRGLFVFITAIVHSPRTMGLRTGWADLWTLCAPVDATVSRTGKEEKGTTDKRGKCNFTRENETKRITLPLYRLLYCIIFLVIAFYNCCSHLAPEQGSWIGCVYGAINTGLVVNWNGGGCRNNCRNNNELSYLVCLCVWIRYVDGHVISSIDLVWPDRRRKTERERDEKIFKETLRFLSFFLSFFPSFHRE